MSGRLAVLSLTIFALAAAADPERACGQATISSTAFNPAISLILDGQFASYSNGGDTYELSGFILDEEVGPPDEGFSLEESELAVSANIDDRFYGFLTAALEEEAGDTEVELEEAWFQTLSLPAGLSFKAGKFLSAVGYHNSFHPHSWHFADAPLAYDALLGGDLADAGLQGRWLAPTDLFVELGAEALRGDAFPAGGAANDGVGSYSAFVKTGDDLGTENSWKAGISYLHYDAEGRTSAVGETDTLSFDGNGEVWILEAVWKWSENGNPKLRNLILQGEYLRREENGKLVLGATATEEGSVDTTQDAFYLQGVYQFVPGWRFGLRYDRLKADNSVAGLTAATALDGDDRSPERWTAMADYSPSEFSRLRLQLSEDSSSADSDTRLILQYVMSLGSHGAHSF